MEKEICYLKSLDKRNCTGCGACYSICPQKAIQMEEDVEGFLYPQIEQTKCINCHLCENVCPINRNLLDIKPKAFSYITNSEENLKNSSSGGAFGDIVDAFYEENRTVIYGCKFDDNNCAIHFGTQDKEQIGVFKKSKYVQSNLLNVFEEIKKYLIEDYKIVFSGTPCQVSGLKSFLSKDYENLLSVDIICHGVPSQKLLDYYIMEESKKNNSKIKSLNFREKVIDKNGRYNSRNIRLNLEDGRVVIKNVKQSSYLLGFHNHLFYRPSCYFCNFAQINRDSDITIADCWGINTVNSDKDVHKGVSCVIINSDKGQKVFENMNGQKDKISINFIVNNNYSYSAPTKYHKNREKFFNNLTVDNFEKKINKYTKRSFLGKVLGYIKRIINTK